MTKTNPYRMLGRINYMVEFMVDKYGIIINETIPDWYDLLIRISEAPNMNESDRRLCQTLANASNGYLSEIENITMSQKKSEKETNKGIRDAKFICEFYPYDYNDKILDDEVIRQHNKHFLTQLLSFKGRLSRSHFFLVMIICYALLISGILIIHALSDFSTGMAYVLGGILILAEMYLLVAARAKRCHDFGKSGYWQLYSFIPYAGVIFAWIMLLSKGHEDPNSYGPNPRDRY